MSKIERKYGTRGGLKVPHLILNMMETLLSLYLSAHEDFGRVLIHSALGVAHIRHIPVIVCGGGNIY